VNEVLSGIRVIKMYAWEKPYHMFVNSARLKELGLLRRIQNTNAGVAPTCIFEKQYDY
jgi:hypothetical protein